MSKPIIDLKRSILDTTELEEAKNTLGRVQSELKPLEKEVARLKKKLKKESKDSNSFAVAQKEYSDASNAVDSKKNEIKLAKSAVEEVRKKYQNEHERGIYRFKRKVYYKNRDFKEGYIHPYKLKWAKYSQYEKPNPFTSYNRWKQIFKATPVVVGDDYWPEGFAPDAEGKYVDMDLVLVKIPIDIHVKHRKRQAEKAELNVRSVKKQFIDKTKEAGIDIPEDVIEEEIERMKRETKQFGV